VQVGSALGEANASKNLMADMAGGDEEDVVGRMSSFSIMNKMKGMNKVGVPPLRLTCRLGWRIPIPGSRNPPESNPRPVHAHS